MGRSIGGKIVLEGAAKYNADLKDISSNLNRLHSEMKLNTEQFKDSRNTTEALSDKSRILSEQYEQAARKVKVYTDYLNETRDAERRTREGLENYKDKLAEAEFSLKEMTVTGRASNDEIAKQRELISELKTKVGDSENAVNSFTLKENQLEAALNNAKAEEIQFGNELRTVSGQLEEAKGNAEGCATSIDKYGNSVSEADKNTGNISNSLIKLQENYAFKQLSEGAKKLLDEMIECAGVAEQFEYSMAKVQSIARVSDPELNTMSEDIRRLGAEMGYSASEISEAVYQAISASVDAADAMSFVKDATTLARAGFTDTTTAVDVMTTALNAYGAEANSTEHIMDALITTQNLGKTTVAELAQSMGTVIPTAAAYNVSLDQLSASYTILTKNGINTANATTYISGMLTELADSGSTVAKILKEKTGKTFGQLTADGMSLGDVMDILKNSVDGDSEAFANLWGNVRAGRGALSIANAGSTEFNKTLTALKNSTGAAREAFETMADTAEMTNQRFSASVENLKIAVGESLSPTLQFLEKIGIGILNVVTEFVEENPLLITALTGAAVTVTTVTAAIAAYNVAMAIANALSQNYAAIAGALAAGAVMGLTVGAISAATAVSDLNDEFKRFISEADAVIEKTEAMAESGHESVEATETEREYIDALIGELDELNNKEELSAREKERVRQIVQELNSRYEGLNWTIDETTGKLSQQNTEWQQNIKNLRDAAYAAAIQDKLTDMYRQQAEAAEKVWEIENKRSILQSELDPKLEEYNRLMAVANTNFSEYYELFNDLDGELQEADIWEYVDAFKELTEEQQKAYLAAVENGGSVVTAAMADAEVLFFETEELTKKIEILNEEYGEATDARDANAESIQNLETYLHEELGLEDELVVSNEELADSYTELSEEEQEALQKMREAAEESVKGQVSLFEELKTSSDLSLEQMRNNFASQAESYAKYSENVAAAMKYMESEGSPAANALLQSVIDMGMNGAGYLDLLVEAAQSGSEEWNEAVEEFANSAIEGERATEQWEEYALRYGEGADRVELMLDEHGTNIQLLKEEQNAEELRLATENTDNILTQTNRMITDSTQAIRTGTPLVTAATREMFVEVKKTATESLGIDASGTSRFFYDMGRDGIDGSLAAGIKSGTGMIAGAINEAVNKAIGAASARLDDIASALDAAIGGAIGG